MTYEIFITPKTEDAKRALKQNFQTLDDAFKEVHDQSFMHEGKRCEHGLTLRDDQPDSVYAHVYAHWDHEHLMATKADVKKIIKGVFGSTKNYEIKESC